MTKKELFDECGKCKANIILTPEIIDQLIYTMCLQLDINMGIKEGRYKLKLDNE